MSRKLIITLITAFVAACASPMLKQTEVSQSAIDREARIQKELAEEQPYKFRKRLERVELKLAHKYFNSVHIFQKIRWGDAISLWK